MVSGKPRQRNQFLLILGVLNSSEFEDSIVNSQNFLELFGVLLRHPVEQLNEVFEYHLLDLFDETGVLQSLPGDVQWQILRVNDDLYPTGPCRNLVITEVGGNEYTLDQKADILGVPGCCTLPVRVVTKQSQGLISLSMKLRWNSQLGWDINDTLERSARRVTRELLPSCRFVVIVFESGLVKQLVFLVGYILSVTGLSSDIWCEAKERRQTASR